MTLVSNWAYVRGFVDTREQLDWDAAFGRECQFESPMKTWDELCSNPSEFMPSGSEGTLAKHIERDSVIDMWHVQISGSLRDVWSPDEIEQWFDALCKAIKPESAECEIDCGYMGYRLMRWNGRRVNARKERW